MGAGSRPARTAGRFGKSSLGKLEAGRPGSDFGGSVCSGSADQNGGPGRAEKAETEADPIRRTRAGGYARTVGRKFAAARRADSVKHAKYRWRHILHPLQLSGG